MSSVLAWPHDTLGQRSLRWWWLLALPLLHFACIKLTYSLAMTPENEVVVWISNAVLLAALFYWRGQCAEFLFLLTLSSEVIANIGVFPPVQSVLFGLCNQMEVFTTYYLMRRWQTSPRLEQVEDFIKFVLAGPVIGTFIASLFATAVLTTLPNVSAPYWMLALLWWFGDSLGMLIFTPLFLMCLLPSRGLRDLRWWDGVVLGAMLVLAALIFVQEPHWWPRPAVMSPDLLLPFVLYAAYRLGPRWTAILVAVIALVCAWSQTKGFPLFGNGSAHLMVLRTQEYVFTLSVIGMGFATLWHEHTTIARELEIKVQERTHDLEVSNARLSALSTTDGLTGIANRRQFDETLANEWARALRAGHSVALAVLDVDWFKQYNDHYGHLAGDNCLRHVAQIFSAHAQRAGDVVARYGGEEFAFIGPATDVNGALEVAHATLKNLRRNAYPHSSTPSGIVTASIGIAVLTPNAQTRCEDLIAAADKALYQAKSEGRDRICVYSDSV